MSEDFKQFQEREALAAALKIIVIGEKDRLQGNGISGAQSRAQLLAARERLVRACRKTGER